MKSHWLAALPLFALLMIGAAHSTQPQAANLQGDLAPLTPDTIPAAASPTNTPTSTAEVPNCSRIELLWQLDEQIGMGPLHLDMTLQEAQAAGQLVISKPLQYALCGVANANFIMDEGAIEVIFDKRQRIISLKSRTVDQGCSVMQQMTQAATVFSDLERLPLPYMPASGTLSAAYYRLGTPPRAWLMLTPEFTQLDNGSCAEADITKAPVSAFH
ncbi:hypothetical protein JYB87_16750 [Shewanella avicenniae]|uniref:Uncharacterized protein n=1 Tax=Shewanella avicenniae TaxID=2814294 RepID=A0ABX7QPE2_9GAMM|nr:hypothetical protein [Shewanella avicenniae]QSX33347.1 hypothetical protein JYB87_16750 [Shewanella avicenniae]